MAVPGSGSFAGMSDAQRNAIVEALLAQADQRQSAPPSYMYGDSVPSDPYAQQADPSDPDTGYATAADIAGPVVASPGDQTGPSPAGLAAISSNAQSSNLSSDALGGNLASPSPGLAAAMAAPVGTPAGYYGGLLSPDNAVTATPTAQAEQAVAQGLTLGGHNIAGYNMAPAFNAFEGAYEGSPQAAPAQQAAPGPVAQGLTLGGHNIAGYNMAPAFNAFEGALQTPTGTPAAPSDFSAVDAAAQAANAAVAAQMSDALAGYSVTGTPATGTPASSVAVGYGVGLGLGDSVSGGFTGGFGGEGDAGGVGIDGGGGVGIGGASTGISGGPGGTGEGGANTGEGGVGDGGGGGGGGSGK